MSSNNRLSGEEIYQYLNNEMLDGSFEKFAKELKQALEKGFNIDYEPQVQSKDIILRMMNDENRLLVNSLLRDKKYTKLLIELGADIAFPGKYGNDILIQAVYKEPDIDIFKVLLEKADVNFKDEYGHTAWYYLVIMFMDNYLKKGKKEFKTRKAFLLNLMKNFLDAGADPYLDDQWLDYPKSDWGNEGHTDLDKYLKMYYEQKVNLKNGITDYDYEI